MAEHFTVVIKNQSVSAVQDLIALYASSTKKLYLEGLELGVNGQATVGNYPISVRYIPATVTAGTGGAAVTPHNLNPDGAAAGFTARRNDVTQATGSPVDYIATMLNPINGNYILPPVPQGDEPKIGLSGALIISLDGISGTLGVSGTVWVREE